MADSPIKQSLQQAVKQAMRDRDRSRLGTLRMALADINRVEVDERTELDDSRVLGLLEKMIKQRRESARQYEEAGRDELATQENAEIAVLEEFMPAALGEAELETLIRETIDLTDATGMQDMGKVMAALRPQVAGRAEMSRVSEQVKRLLSQD